MSTTPEHAEHLEHDHRHGEGCGHEARQHGDHVDYLHDGHVHREHEGHYDECSSCGCEQGKACDCTNCQCENCNCPNCGSAA